MHRRFLKTFVSVFGALALSACASREVTVREPVNIPTIAEADTLANTVVSHHIRLSAPEGWQFRRKKKEDPKEVLFWLSDSGSNSTQGVVRMNKLDFQLNMQLAGPRYAEVVMTNFVDKEARETELDGYPAQIVSGKHENGSVARISALVSTRSKNLVEITFASSSNQFISNPQVPYSILSSYKLMPSSLSARYVRNSFSFRCHDGQWRWVDDVENPFTSRGFLVVGMVEGALMLIEIAEVSTAQFRDLLNMKLFKDPEYPAEVHLAGLILPARGIGYQDEKKMFTDTRYLVKYGGKDYMVGVARQAKTHEAVDIKSLHEHPEVRAALDNHFFFNQ